MLKLNKNAYIIGNTLAKPKKEYTKSNKKNQKRRKANSNKFIIKNAIQISSALIVCGMATLITNSYVFQLQKELNKLEYTIDIQKEIQEAYNVDLLQVSSINNIQTFAKDNNMGFPTKEQIIKIDTSKEYFSHIN